jgi:hypothetical protein
MRNDPLIKDLMTEIRAYIECEKDVDLLDLKTWSDTPYKKEFARAEELIWNAIAPRAAHQQRVENLVQTVKPTLVRRGDRLEPKYTLSSTVILRLGRWIMNVS